MAKGGGGAVLLAMGAAAGIGYLVLSGKIPGYGQGTPNGGDATKAAEDAGSQAAHTGGALFDWWFSFGWAYTATAAGGLALLGVLTWKKIGGWGRAAVLVLAAITVTVLVTR